MPQRHGHRLGYFYAMPKETTVIYNESCPVCRFEITAYRRYAQANGLTLEFADLNRANLSRFGLTPDDAARRLYLVQDGTLLSGMDAFRVLWKKMPRYAWLARVTGWPLLRPATDWLYDRIAAPLLYAAHRRRQAKQG